MTKLSSSFRHLLSVFVLSALALVAAGCGADSIGSTPNGDTSGTGSSVTLPHYDHVVVVMEENHSADEIYNAGDAAYINMLAQSGAVFTNAHGVTHPSEPNYLALFAGDTFGLTSDACPQQYSADNLASSLIAHGKTFIGYSESMPKEGFTGCSAGGDLYARKHNPWVNFSNVPSSSNQPMSSFPSDNSQLPTVAFVVPNQQDDMHSGPIRTADDWLKSSIDSYAQWAVAHNSLLIVTWDEDDGSTDNGIPMIFFGAHIKPGQITQSVTHYDVLRTIEGIFALPYTGQAGGAQTIDGMWQ